MKRKLWLVLFIGMCLVFITPLTASAKVTTLSYATMNSELGWGPAHADIPWIKQIEKDAKGKLKIQPYWNNTLAKGPNIWKAVKSGVADMGWAFHGFWPGMTSLADVISLPALPFNTGEKGAEVLWKLYEKFPSIQEQFKDNKVLCAWTSHPYILITTKKQVKTLEDIKGMKIRMTGGPPTDMMKALGGVPMMISMKDNYITMQKGVTDGMGAPWEAIWQYRLYEVVKYYTETPFPAVYFTQVINRNVWKGLPKDIQDAFNKNSGLKASKFWGKNYFDTAKEDVMKTANKFGFTLDNYYKLPASEKARWLKIGGKPIWDQWVKKMEKQGHPEAKEILEAALKFCKE